MCKVLAGYLLGQCVAEVKRTVLTKQGRYTAVKDNLHAREAIVGDGKRRRGHILSYNPKQAQQQKKHRAHPPQALGSIDTRRFSPHPTNAQNNPLSIVLLTYRSQTRVIQHFSINLSALPTAVPIQPPHDMGRRASSGLPDSNNREEKTQPFLMVTS
jgi:hypothetical protein